MKIDKAEYHDEEKDKYEAYSFVADKGQGIIRLDKFVTDRIQGASRNKIQQAIKSGEILVNEDKVKPNHKIKPLDEIKVFLEHEPEKQELKPENIPLDIVYEDDDLAIINKPFNMVVHPGYGNHSGTLVNGLIYHFSNLPKNKSIIPRPGLVHRIDKNTTGLLLIAKTDMAMTHLSKQFADRKIDRLYQAIVWGSLKESEGKIVGNIGRGLKNRKIMQVFPDGDYGKHACTYYKVLKDYSYVSLIECKLETGRTHQIRTHLKHLGHPLFGDPEYGGNKILKGTTFSKYRQFINNCFKALPRQALHAKTLGFIHPKTKEKMFFNSELPSDMQHVLEKFDRYTANR